MVNNIGKSAGPRMFIQQHNCGFLGARSGSCSCKGAALVAGEPFPTPRDFQVVQCRGFCTTTFNLECGFILVLGNYCV